MNLIFLLLFLLPGSWSYTLNALIHDDGWDAESTPDQIEKEEEFNNLFKEGVLTASRVDFPGGGSIDDGPVDCFGLTPLLQKALQWIFKPQSKEEVGTKFFLSTRTNPNRSVWTPYNGGSFYQTDFQDNSELIFIVHGFLSNSRDPWVLQMTHSLLKKKDVNVVAVDWGGTSISWKYWKAVGNTKVVAEQMADFLRRLPAKLTRSQIHCIGHSLGAHICAYAARLIGTFGRITGLDPAQPCFKGRGLQPSDADYVDVVHTNAAWFGRFEALGFHDFYPNGGWLQPGCRLRDTGLLEKFPITIKKLENAICSHGRSYQFYIDSIRSDECRFWGRNWDFSWKGALKAGNETCTPMTCSPMGLDSIKYPGSGAFFFVTNDRTPFCVPEGNNKKQMQKWANRSRSWNLKNWRKPNPLANEINAFIMAECEGCAGPPNNNN